MRLVEHVRGVEIGDSVHFRVNEFIEDQEELERFDRTRVEVVVPILAVVEVEAGEFSELYQPRHDHFDVDVRRMMSQINQALRLRAELRGAVIARAPVVDDRRIESRLVKLMLYKTPPVVGQRPVDLAQAFEVAFEGAAKALLPRKVSAVAD